MKMQVPSVNTQPWVLPVTLVCLVLGALIAFMVRVATTEDSEDTTTMSREQLISAYTVMRKDYKAMQKELNELRMKREEILNEVTNTTKIQQQLQKDINDLRVYAGSSPIEGPGIVIKIDDSGIMKNTTDDVNANALLAHDLDLLMLVNELRVAGAEALAINDQRVTGSSAIRCVGPSIQVNGHPVSAPFVVRAIGKPDVLYGAMNLPLGVVDQLKQLGIKVNVDKRDVIRVPALTVLPVVEVGKVVTEKTTDTTSSQ